MGKYEKYHLLETQFMNEPNWMTMTYNDTHQMRRGIDIFSYFALKTNVGVYSLEVPHWGTSNEYPQHMFHWATSKIEVFFGWKKKKCPIWSYGHPPDKNSPLKRQSQLKQMTILIFWFSEENKSWHFMWIICQAGDSHEISRLVFSEK